MKLAFSLLLALILGIATWMGFNAGSKPSATSAGKSAPVSATAVPHEAGDAGQDQRRAANTVSMAQGDTLERPFFEVIAWKPQAPKLEPLAPEETLASRQVRAIGVIGKAALPPLRSLRVGQRVLLPVRQGPPLAGTVNLVKEDDGGWLRVGGSVEGDAEGGFSLSQKGNEWAGLIRDAARGTAYFLKMAEDGSLQLIEKPLRSAQCLATPRRPRPPGGANAPSDGGGGGPVAASSVTVPVLDSLPSATHVVYLDFDGEVVTDPDWNNGFTINAQPPTIGSGPITPALITEIWKRVSEDMRPYNISVTTEPARYTAAGAGRRMRCIITSTDVASPGAGGVAYVDSYDQAGSSYSSTVPCWAFTESYYNTNDIAGIISHEVGHTFGLSHDGRYEATDPRYEEYYEGHGSGATSWGPLMGTTYDRAISQWSKGEYADASNPEDDLAIIGSAANGFLNRADDAPNTAPGTPLPNTGLFNQNGTITAASDVDLYSFTTPGGNVVINAAPAAVSPNLDIILELRAANGLTILHYVNPAGPAKASLTQTVAAGTYVIAISSSGLGTASTGYTSYGSIGEYQITGTFPAVPDSPPVIITQPVSLTVNAGAKAVLGVEAISNVAMSYQWTRDNVPLAGQTRATLTISKTAATSAGDYRCIVSNVQGSTTSDPATLTVNFQPVITTHPLTQSANAGNAVTLTCAASGVPAPALRWQRNNVDIAGANATTLLIPSAQWADGGKYRCIATNSRGSAISRTAVLTIVSAPVVLTQPPGTLLVPLNGSASIGIAAAGTGRLTYQWFQNNVPLAGKTAGKLSLARITTAMNGSYRCDITNALGTTSSTECVVTVQDSPVITSQPAGITIARGKRATLRVVAVGAPALKYEWFKDGVKIPGSSAALGVPGSADADYHAVVTNTFGQAISSVAHVTVHDVPKVVAQPLGQLRAIGGTVTFGVVVTGTAPFSYQWTKNKAPIAGATGDSLTLTDLAAADAAYYACTITNDIGTATSASARLTLQTAPSIIEQPASLTVDAFGAATLKVTATGSATLKYQWLKDGLIIPGATAATLKITNAQTSHDGDYSVVVSNAVGSATSAPATLTVTPVAPPSVSGFFPPIASAGHYVRVFGANLNWATGAQMRNSSGSPVAAAFAIVSADEVLITVPTGGVASKIEVITRGGTAASPNPLPVTGSNDTNNHFGNARVIPPAGGTVTGSNTTFTAQGGEPRHAMPSGYPYPSDFDAKYSGWFQWTPSVSGSYYFNTAGSLFDTRVAVYTGNSVNALTVVAYDDDQDPANGIYTGRAYLVATAGTTYYIAIDGFFYDYSGYGDYYDEHGSYKLAVTRIASPIVAASSAREPWISGDALEVTGEGLILGGEGARANELAWLPSRAPAGSRLIEARVTLSYQGSGGQFGLIAYDEHETPRFGINIAAADGALSVITEAGVSKARQRITAGQPHEFLIETDLAAQTWSASVGGVYFIRNAPLPGGAAPADFAAQWIPSSSGSSTLTIHEAEITAGSP